MNECKALTIGPISAASTLGGDAVELECVSPAHAPGVVSVAVGRGTGRAEDVRSTFTFMQDAAVDAAAEDDADWPQVTGGAMQVHPIKRRLKPPGTKRLKLKMGILLSTSAFKFNLCRHTPVTWEAESATCRALPCAMTFPFRRGTLWP